MSGSHGKTGGNTHPQPSSNSQSQAAITKTTTSMTPIRYRTYADDAGNTHRCIVLHYIRHEFGGGTPTFWRHAPRPSKDCEIFATVWLPPGETLNSTDKFDLERGWKYFSRQYGFLPGVILQLPGANTGRVIAVPYPSRHLPPQANRNAAITKQRTP